jgi:pyruvate formate lyase activating enzyme
MARKNSSTDLLEKKDDGELVVLTGMVFNIVTYSVSDGAGIRTTVFLKGSPKHCRSRQNPKAISRRQEITYRQDRA